MEKRQKTALKMNIIDRPWLLLPSRVHSLLQFPRPSVKLLLFSMWSQKRIPSCSFHFALKTYMCRLQHAFSFAKWRASERPAFFRQWKPSHSKDFDPPFIQLLCGLLSKSFIKTFWFLVSWPASLLELDAHRKISLQLERSSRSCLGFGYHPFQLKFKIYIPQDYTQSPL